MSKRRAAKQTLRRQRELAERSRRQKRRRFLLGAGLVAAVSVAVGATAAVLAGRQSESPPESAAPAAQAEATAGGTNADAPGFTVKTIEGESFALAAQRGKVVVVDFLAPG